MTMTARLKALARRDELHGLRTHDPVAEARREAAERKLAEDFPAPPPPPQIPPGSRAEEYWREWAAGKPTATPDHLADVAFAALLAGGEWRARRTGGVEYASAGARRAGPADIAEAMHRMEASAPVRYLG